MHYVTEFQVPVHFDLDNLGALRFHTPLLAHAHNHETWTILATRTFENEHDISCCE